MSITYFLLERKDVTIQLLTYLKEYLAVTYTVPAVKGECADVERTYDEVFSNPEF